MRLRGNLFLLGAAFIWGTTFVAQMVGMDGLGPFSYAAPRFLLGLLSLLLIYAFFAKSRATAKLSGAYKSGWKAGLCAGCIMFAASSLQQIAMLYTTAGKTAFITCLYIVFVPLFSVILGKRLGILNVLGALLATVGLYFLSIRGDFSLSAGDGIVLLSSLFWTLHILYIGNRAPLVDAIELSITQISVCAFFSALAAFAFESPTWSAVYDAKVAIFYGGVMSAGVAFTFQIIGQKYADPSSAAIIMSLESVFGGLAGWLLLGEIMSGREILGAALMVLGMIVTQLRLKKVK